MIIKTKNSIPLLILLFSSNLMYGQIEKKCNDFKQPIPAGTIVELIGKVTYLGNTSIKVRVEIHVEQMYSNHREKAVSGEFTFVAIDENKKPIKVISNELNSVLI